jgi:hypothetical protein
MIGQDYVTNNPTSLVWQCHLHKKSILDRCLEMILIAASDPTWLRRELWYGDCVAVAQEIIEANC